MVVNLDPQFAPYPNETQISFEMFCFPGGEPHIKIDPNTVVTEQVTITHRVTSFHKFAEVLLATDALKRMGFSKIHLMIPYLPAARQDRVMVMGEPLTVKVYTDLINAQGYDRVTIFDPHSDVAPALLNNCVVEDNIGFVEQVVAQIPEEDLLLVSPDGGALKKIYQVAQALKKYEVVECSKSRDVTTGMIKDFKVYADNLDQKPCLIVDDICDGGGTFLGLAKALKAKNAGKLYLAVSHGIFSQGYGTIKKHFDHIFTTDSFKTIENDRLITQLSMADLQSCKAFVLQ